jgi:hypothetical protein
LTAFLYFWLLTLPAILLLRLQFGPRIHVLIVFRVLLIIVILFRDFLSFASFCGFEGFSLSNRGV